MHRYKPEYLYLTTTGWKTGQQHEIEIWYVPHNGSYYLMAEARDRAHWVRNLRANPAVTFHVGGEHFAGSARAIDEEQEPVLVEAVKILMQDKYGWNTGLIVELMPQAPTS